MNPNFVFVVSASYGGVIVNTGGWVRGSGYDSLKHAAGSFEGLYTKKNKPRHQKMGLGSLLSPGLEIIKLFHAQLSRA